MSITRRVSVIAPVAGLLLGFLDFVWIKFVPAHFGGLGNSIAVWAVAAFLLAFFLRWPAVRAVAAAVIMLLIAVPSYYIAAALIQHDDWSTVWGVAARQWMVLGVIAGLVFGFGGVVARQPGPLRRPALGLAAAVLFAEAILQLPRIGQPSYNTADIVQYVLVLVALAVLSPLAVARTWPDRALALAYAVPVSGVGYLLMTATAFRSK
ncbi:DUF6518 family protein [Micromonospora sp. WMMD736]|uniref:DUF6518 family protein n=1 Tax=Micromonospora sp. WMMD736 TaxID=3404112 RepID=UPI003B922E41